MKDKSTSNSLSEDDDANEVFLKSAAPHWMLEAEEIQFSEDSLKLWEKDSAGTYTAVTNKLKQCEGLPISAVWAEFSHFFNYNWDKDFINFSALFLTFWKRESNFAPVSQGVIVQPNCKKKPPLVVRGLKGISFKEDLLNADKKIKTISRHFAGCTLRNTDYGAMQWNYKFRLSQNDYKKTMQKALLISSRYSRKQIHSLNQEDLAKLVKLNPRTLFILAGLDIKKRTSDVNKTIRNYNSKPEYFKMATANFSQFRNRLVDENSCRP